jgi:hypothetical protein
MVATPAEGHGDGERSAHSTRRHRDKEIRMSASTIHVEPTPAGRWIVRHDDERNALSEHESATAAQRVACDLAQIEGASRVLLHDRYSRVHYVPVEADAQDR